MKIIITLILSILTANCVANTLPTAWVNGTTDERHAVYAFTNAHIFVDSKTEIENGVLVLQDNKILNVGSDITLPENAIIRDLHGAYIYPAFILLDSDYGLPEMAAKVPFSWGAKEVMDSTLTGAANTNEAIKASYQAVKEFTHAPEQAQALREIGFATVLSSKHDGIMRGTSVLVNLNEAAEQQSIIQQQQAFHLSFDKGSSQQLYPVSLMGASALIRQTWLDAMWYGKGQTDFTDLDLQAINQNKNRLHIFSVDSWQQTLLADKIAKEFNQAIVLQTAGDEYKHIDAIKKINRHLIVPLEIPAALDVKDSLDAWNVSAEELIQWQAAPYNLYYLNKNGIEFSIIPKHSKTFLKDLRTVVKKGLPKAAALAGLTSTPAKILAQSDLGHLNRGAQANFIISQDDLFAEDATIAENWVAGKKYVINALTPLKSGNYQLSLKGQSDEIKVINTAGKLKISSSQDDDKTTYKATIDNQFVQFEITKNGNTQRLLGVADYNSINSIQGQSPQWSMLRVSDIKPKSAEAAENQTKDSDTLAQVDATTQDQPPVIPKPFSPYGLFEKNPSQSFLITNTTVWTNEDDGVLTATDVYINHGKIEQIGKDLRVKAEQVIDGSKQHLSAGIIDEHSHIALLSVNDIMANSSMVRMQDAIDSDDINIYRNLAGGVTAAQLLHGSANPLGGQSALIKMRWGATADELLIEGADKFIKFALGENVKRSSSQSSIRYPQTRMGVEQVYRDAFNNALAYEKQWQDYNKLSGKGKKQATAPRRDLMLEATLEIINKTRFITSHSYVQSEINMLMQVANDFGFNVNTFTHILEGYKLADKMLAHGVGASTFSDWWSYKWEVNYAIPANAAIMSKMGITTAINSDDAEMSRRLNQEAAKSIKYGDLSEAEALKMVTLNPAKLLHLDKRMGSIKVGKDADIVLWSDNPISIYAKANKTFVDGRLLFDRDKQAEIEQQIQQNRELIINQMNATDGPKLPAMGTIDKHLHCDSLTGYEYMMGAAE